MAWSRLNGRQRDPHALAAHEPHRRSSPRIIEIHVEITSRKRHYAAMASKSGKTGKLHDCYFYGGPSDGLKMQIRNPWEQDVLKFDSARDRMALAVKKAAEEFLEVEEELEGPLELPNGGETKEDGFQFIKSLIKSASPPDVFEVARMRRNFSRYFEKVFDECFSEALRVFADGPINMDSAYTNEGYDSRSKCWEYFWRGYVRKRVPRRRKSSRKKKN